MRSLSGFSRRVWLLVVVVITGLATLAVAQEPAPDLGTELSPMALLTVLIPFVVPMLLAVVKELFAAMPLWLLPYLAPLVGALADIAIHVGSGGATPLNPVLGAILGSAGVGVREAVDQAKQRLTNGPAAPR